MPAKRVIKSRLNSIVDIKDLKSKDEKPVVEEISSNTQVSEPTFFEYEDECFEEEWQGELRKPLSRTSLLVLDYHKFKAARCIQRFVRGWLARIKYERLQWAAFIIQKEWRRFYYRRAYYVKLETFMQKTIEQHYYNSALKIQSLWRGWWVREHIHDHNHLIRLQVTAGEDLLHCVAFKLHHLLRTHQIPGIFSLRNSKALSKVEKLLSTLTFKTCTDRVRIAHDFRQTQIRDAKKVFANSRFATKVPFPGHNIHNICVTKCMPLYTEKDADRKMHKILRMYEEINRTDPRLQKRLKISKEFRGICKPPPMSFCGDVVHSMKKWKIFADNQMQVDPNIFKRPENLENFLKECRSWWSLLHGRCHCRQDYVEKMANKDLEDLKKKKLK